MVVKKNIVLFLAKIPSLPWPSLILTPTVLYNEEQLNMTLLYYCSGWDMPLKHFSVTAEKILALHDEAGTPRFVSLGSSESSASTVF